MPVKLKLDDFFLMTPSRKGLNGAKFRAFNLDFFSIKNTGISPGLFSEAHTNPVCGYRFSTNFLLKCLCRSLMRCIQPLLALKFSKLSSLATSTAFPFKIVLQCGNIVESNIYDHLISRAIMI